MFPSSAWKSYSPYHSAYLWYQFFQQATLVFFPFQYMSLLNQKHRLLNEKTVQTHFPNFYNRSTASQHHRYQKHDYPLSCNEGSHFGRLYRVRIQHRHRRTPSQSQITTDRIIHHRVSSPGAGSVTERMRGKQCKSENMKNVWKKTKYLNSAALEMNSDYNRNYKVEPL